ncbi:hypothetical protein [Paenibacillus apiarius]|uniref:hypothetical protein n=1 Tax=Paenibacillus apiarius TaxID=46240 RepID=UPI00300CDBB9
MRERKVFTLLVVVSMLWSIVGCAGTDSGHAVKEGETKPISTDERDSATASAFPRTIKHLKGETVIEARPLKIATPYISFVDYMAVLDEYPIAAQGVETIMHNFPSLSKRVAGKEMLDLGMEVNRPDRHLPASGRLAEDAGANCRGDGQRGKGEKRACRI